MYDMLSKVYERRDALIKDWKKREGNILGYFYSFVPVELIWAFGIWPVQMTEKPKSHPLSDAHLQEFVCDFAHLVLEDGLSHELSFLDGLIFPYVCDPLRMLYGIWRRNVETPFLHFLAIPQKAESSSIEYYKRELLELKEHIEDFFGIHIREDDIFESFSSYKEARELLEGITKNGSFLDRLLSILFFTQVPPNIFTKYVNEFLGSKDEEGTPIFLSFQIFEEAICVIELLFELGVKIVADDLDFGLRYAHIFPELNNDPIHSLAVSYLGNIPVPVRYKTERRVETLVKRAKESSAKGAIFLFTKYCDIYFFEYPYISDVFAKAGIPTLLIETTDSISKEAVRTRIEAFVETLQ